MKSHSRLARLLAACACALSLAGAADLLAQGAGAPAPVPMPSPHERNMHIKAEFDLLDTNHDRRISRAEFEANAEKAIRRAEQAAKMHDYQPSMVSQLYQLYDAQPKYPTFAQVDDDGDGEILFHKEFLRFSPYTFYDFSNWDLDADGKITKREYMESNLKAQERRKTTAGDEVFTPVSEEQFAAEFAFRDRNHDGRVTWAELRALDAMRPHFLLEGTFADLHFVQLDTDHDGVVARDEFLARGRESGKQEFLRLEEKVFRLRDLDGNASLSYAEFAQTAENLARGFLGYDKDEDGVVRFEDVEGIEWFTGKNPDRDRCYFNRLDVNHDRRVTWKEYRSASPRGNGFDALDHLTIDNSISREEWNAVEREYLVGQRGEALPANAASGYATTWLPGIFDLITFADLDVDKDGAISWDEFRSFPS